MIELILLVAAGLGLVVASRKIAGLGQEGKMPTVAYYRTRDGRADYRFSFEEQGDGTWRAYILRQPGYGSRATDLHSTHRLTRGDRYYVCWTDPLRTLEQAKQVAALWADKTQEYIRTGQRF